MSSIDITQMLHQLRAVASQAEGAPPATANIDPAERQDFAGLLKESINRVNATQQYAGHLAAAFEAGDESVNLAQVVIAQEKAGLAFQALTQTRNKLLSAYQEIMSMQV